MIPDWQEKDAPLETPVSRDVLKIFFEKNSFQIPNFLLPKSVHNEGNYLISLSSLVRWLGEQAEEMGVDILPGFAADQIFENADGSVGGVITGDFGIAKDGEQKDTYMPGMIIKAQQTIFSEGCRGSLSERLFKKFDLDQRRVNP